MSCQYEKKRLDYATDYVRGDLPEDKMEAFEAHYLECEECFSAVRFAEKTAVTMHQYGATIFAPAGAFAPATVRPASTAPEWLTKLKEEWEDICLAFSKEWKTALPAIGVYVMLAVALGLGYYRFISSSRLASQQISHAERPSAMFPSGPARMIQLEHLTWLISDATQENATLYKRLKVVEPLYKHYNDFLAAERLSEIVKDFPESIEANLYLGILQLRANQLEEGINSLHQVLKSDSENAAAQWYLAQGYILHGDLTEAQTLLAGLVDRHDLKYDQRADTLLKEIAKKPLQNK